MMFPSERNASVGVLLNLVDDVSKSDFRLYEKLFEKELSSENGILFMLPLVYSIQFFG